MKVFISSTYQDMLEYRQEVFTALVRAGYTYIGMEHFGPASRPPLSQCLGEIALVDIVVCIVGARYGSRANNGLSYTENEVNEAVKLGKPVLVFFLDWDKQPVIPAMVDVGKDRRALDKFKNKLQELFTVDQFLSPLNLATKVVSALSKRSFQNIAIQAVEAHADKANIDASIRLSVPRFRETAYDTIADWYDYWYKNHWNDEEPSNTVCELIKKYSKQKKIDLTKLSILDVACGTGNTYAPLKRRGLSVFGCDGSARMLACAVDNCEGADIPTEGIVKHPINWTDGEGYREIFGDKKFDVIVNTANSFCHIPPVSEYMDLALRNFRDLLKPDGILIIDTKRYMKDGEADGVPIFKELMRGENNKWVIRNTRDEYRDIEGMGVVHFHTKLYYDTDPSFSPVVPRALIILTIYRDGLPPQNALVPYYPLPAETLADRMSVAGFRAEICRANKGPAVGWKYDIVVGQLSRQFGPQSAVRANATGVAMM